MNKLFAYLTPLVLWIIGWWLILNGAAYTFARALTGDALKGLGDTLLDTWNTWKGLFSWL